MVRYINDPRFPQGVFGVVGMLNADTIFEKVFVVVYISGILAIKRFQEIQIPRDTFSNRYQ